MSSAIFVQLATKHGSLPRVRKISAPFENHQLNAVRGWPEHLTATAESLSGAEECRRFKATSFKRFQEKKSGDFLPPEKHINPVISIGWCIYIYYIYITPLISGWNDPSQIIYFRPFIGGSISSISFTSQAPPTQPGCPPLRGYFWHALQRLWRKIRLPWSIDVSGSVNRW